MPTTAELLASAIAQHRAGRLQSAAEIYRQILAAQPAHPEALHLLGVVEHQAGRPQQAVALIERAIAASGPSPIYYNNLGEAYRALKLPVDAERSYRRAIELNPSFAGPYYNLANVLKDEERLDEAAACYERALALQPDYPAALNNLGNLRKSQKRLDDAIACYQRALQLRPNSAEAYSNLGNAWHDRQEIDKSLAALQQAIALAPGQAEFHINLGNVLRDIGRGDEARSAYQQAIDLNPQLAVAHFGLGCALHGDGELSGAIACYRRALELDPAYSEALNNLANAWKDQGDLDQALALFDQALEVDPNSLTALSNKLFTLQYRAGITAAELLTAHREYERRQAAPLRSTWRPHANVRDPDRPLRIGFLSPDLRRHPVAYFLIRGLEQVKARSDSPPHPRPLSREGRGENCDLAGEQVAANSTAGCEIICYKDRWTVDEWTRRFQAVSSQWRQVGAWSDEQIAEQIRADKVDILFDLTGHTAHNRLLVFARKPAPVQITWIGYEGTTGLEAMDYILADRYVIPPGAEQHYQERVLRLPHGYLCYDPPLEAPPVGPLPLAQSGRVTFASFNNLSKITPQVVDVWARILRSVPGSRLILRYKGLGDANVQRRFQGLFAAAGVGPEQLDLRAPVAYEKYLATYNEVDIGLDPFPFAGGTVTCEALWMGVPVVTCPGDTLASRHTFSHLQNIGITDSMASSLDEYVATAVRLAGDPARLAAIRAELRPRMAASPLCDGRQFAEDFVALMRQVWRDWLAANR